MAKKNKKKHKKTELELLAAMSPEQIALLHKLVDAQKPNRASTFIPAMFVSCVHYAGQVWEQFKTLF